MTEVKELEGFDTELEKLRKHWDAPGIACVVLKDNEIAYSHAVGLRDIENNLPMTVDTIQPIGSCGKSFTSTAVAMLVDDGKLDWDTPIHKMFPKFELKDPIASQNATLIDVLSHRSGLPRHDIVWLNDTFTYDMVFDYLPHLEPSRDFRTTFQYCNLMYIAAAALVEEISGTKYREFLKKRIMKPLKLNAISTIEALIESKDHSKGYNYNAGNREEVKYDDVAKAEWIAATGAGSINAATADLAKWLRFHLNKGSVNGKQILSPDNITRTHKPVTVIGSTSLDQWVPGQKWVKQVIYALGWFSDVYRGVSRLRHGGATEGSSTQLQFLPDEGIGVGVMVNEYGTPLSSAVASILLDKLLKLEPVDWSEVYKPSWDAWLKVLKETKEKEEELKLSDTQLTHPVEEYVGKYHNPGYGVFAIILENNELKLRYGNRLFPMTHYHYDTFQYSFDRYEFRDTLTFYTESSGDIESFTIRIETQVPPIKFMRMPDEHLSDPEFLSKIVGKYEYYGRIVDIKIKDENKLVFAMPGAPSMELVPVRGMRFKPKASSSRTITFQEENGEINGFMVSDFGGVVPGKRIKS